jgi:hypothetical protein
VPSDPCATAAPYRLCCMQRHHGPMCPDGKVMCCICFGRFDVADLVTYPGDDVPTDVCKVCAKRDERAIREARNGT